MCAQQIFKYIYLNFLEKNSLTILIHLFNKVYKYNAKNTKLKHQLD